ncbi:MAG: flippase, partial [Janthinobacterium lividum]
RSSCGSSGCARVKRSSFSANFTYNVIGALVPIVTSLGTVPFYIHQIGAGRYGVVTITWVLLGYFGFLDFGMSRASANALARIGVSSAHDRSRVLMTAFYSNLLMGIIGGLMLYVAGALILLHVVKIPGSLMIETRNAYPWMAAMLPLGMLGGVFTGALESRERFLLSNMLSAFGTMAGQLTPLACAYLIGPSLMVVIPATLLSRFLMVALSAAIVARQEWPIRLLDFDLVWLRKLFGYGSWVSVSGLLNPILDTSNQLVLGAMLGAAAVASYSIPMTLAMRSQVVATALARTLFPLVSRSEPAEAQRTTRTAASALAYGFGIVCAPAILFSSTFLHLWMGAKFAAISTPVAQILMFGAWSNGVAFLPYGFLQAQGRPQVAAKVGLIEVVPFFLVLWFLIGVMGLSGAALAWTLRVTINCVALFVLSGCLDRSMVRLLPALGMMLVSLAVARWMPMSIGADVGASIIVGVLFAILGMLFDSTLRYNVHRLIRRTRVQKSSIHNRFHFDES